MKILVVCQHYWPEPYPLADICEGLVQRGHEVHVLTDVPNYPMGRIYDGYRHGKTRRQEHRGVEIERCFTIGRRHNVLFRMLNYYSYAASSTLRALFMREEYDVVFANQTSPVMMISAGLAYARKREKKCVMYCMDLWPASLSVGGVSESSPLYRYFQRVSRRLYNRADEVLITSRMFCGYLMEKHGVPEDRIEYLPQYASDQFRKLPTVGKKATVDFVFAGNIGAAQSLKTVLDAAEQLRDVENLRWHIVGDGSELENLKEEAQRRNLAQIIFYGRKPGEEMPRFYAMADAMLVTLVADPAISLTLPGKVQTYMAAGKPILGAANGEIPDVIRAADCGYCAAAEDGQGLADAVRRFLDHPNPRALGENARRYYEGHFSKDIFMEHLEKVLQAACRNRLTEDRRNA